jgi:hypothetical protein
MSEFGDIFAYGLTTIYGSILMMGIVAFVVLMVPIWVSDQWARIERPKSPSAATAGESQGARGDTLPAAFLALKEIRTAPR